MQGEQDRSACYGNYQWVTTNASSASKGGGTRREDRDFSEAGVAGRTALQYAAGHLLSVRVSVPYPNIYISRIISGNSETTSDSESSRGNGTWSPPSSQENHIFWSGRKVGEQEYKYYYLNSKYIDFTRKNSINTVPYWKIKAKLKKHYFQFFSYFCDTVNYCWYIIVIISLEAITGEYSPIWGNFMNKGKADEQWFGFFFSLPSFPWRREGWGTYLGEGSKHRSHSP